MALSSLLIIILPDAAKLIGGSNGAARLLALDARAGADARAVKDKTTAHKPPAIT